MYQKATALIIISSVAFLYQLRLDVSAHEDGAVPIFSRRLKAH